MIFCHTINKYFRFQATKREFLNSLAGKFGFEIWEINCSDDFSSGILAFKTFMSAYTFCRENVHCSFLEISNVWYERFSEKIASDFLHQMCITLNEDCIDEIAKKLDLIGMADLLAVRRSHRLIRIARQRFGNLIIDSSTVGHRFGEMNLCYILHVFGDILTNVTISMNCFRGGVRNQWNIKSKYGILCFFCDFTGSNLESITLQNFANNKHMPRFNSKILELREKNILLNIN